MVEMVVYSACGEAEGNILSCDKSKCQKSWKSDGKEKHFDTEIQPGREKMRGAETRLSRLEI